MNLATNILLRSVILIIIFVPAILYTYKIKSLSDYKQKDSTEKKKVKTAFISSCVGLMITLVF